MKLSLIENLVCPTCRKQIVLRTKKRQGNEIIQGKILCLHCKDQFSIIKGIPRFVTDKTDDFIRKKTVSMSIEQCTEFSKDMTYLGKSLAKLKKKITIPHDIPILGVKAGTYDVQRFIYWHFLKCFWGESDDFQRSVSVNFDWYYPKFAFRHTSTEVRKWFKDSKIKIKHFKEIESGISVTGKKLKNKIINKLVSSKK